MRNGLTKIQVWAFLIILGVFTWFGYKIIEPYISIMLLAATLALVCYPLKEALRRRIKSDSASSFLTVVFLLIVLGGLATLLGGIINAEVSDVNFAVIPDQLLGTGIANWIPNEYSQYIHSFSRDISGIFAFLSRSLASQLQAIISNVTRFILDFILLLISLYYFLRDGKSLVRFIVDLLPIAPGQEEMIFNRITKSVDGIIKGSLMVGFVQAVVALAGFLIFGFPKPWLFAFFTLFAAFVPFVGTALVFIPAVLYLLISGAPWMALGLAIWGTTAVGLVDNFISPQLISKRVNIHPLIALIAVIGGFEFFGFLGFLLGPICAAVLLTLIDIYKTQVREIVE